MCGRPQAHHPGIQQNPLRGLPTADAQPGHVCGFHHPRLVLLWGKSAGIPGRRPADHALPRDLGGGGFHRVRLENRPGMGLCGLRQRPDGPAQPHFPAGPFRSACPANAALPLAAQAGRLR